MKTTTEEVKAMLLTGRHITKLDLFYESEVSSSCLPQRIYDIRQTTDWDIKSQSVKGKGTLREYWLEPEEINRIKSKINASESVSARENKSDEQLLIENRKLAEQATESLKNEDEAYGFEQMGLGLLGGENLKQRW